MRFKKKIAGLSLIAAAVLGSLGLAQTWRPGSRLLDRAPLQRTLPASVAWEGGGAGGDPWALFDGDLRRGLAGKDGEPARVRLELDPPRQIAAVGVHGASCGQLTISAELDGVWVPVHEIELDASSRGWRRFPAESPITARTLLVDWQPATPGAALPEIELWSAGSSDASRIVRARPAAGAIGAGTEAVFHLRLDRDPGMFQRAFLAYELDGLPDWPAAVRAINGLPAQGGFAARAAAGAGLQLEEINPAWLRRGRNEVRFFPVAREDLPPASVAGLRARSGSGSGPGAEILPYTVRNLRLVLVGDDGHPLVRDAVSAAPAPSAQAAALVDRNPSTAWDGAEAVELPLRRASQPWVLDLVTSGRPAGELVVEAVLPGGATEPLARLDLSDLPDRSDLSGLDRHRLRLDEDLPAITALRLAWPGHSESGGTIVEADLLASPAGTGVAPRLQLTRPVSGDAAGVGLRGFAGGAPVELLIDNLPVAAALTPQDGAFEVYVPRPAASGAWEVALTLVYPDGSRLTHPVRLSGDPDEDDPRQESAEAEASPGEAKSLALGRARLDVPAGALGQKVALSMRALGAGELPALDTGMTNVTPARGGFRMGPHGLRFRQPVRLTLPYDPELIPAGLTEDDVQTYFFDEESGRWLPVSRIAVEAGRRTVVSATDHFTDFINATLTVPDEPAGASATANSVQELAAADPAAQITLIAPPEGGPAGDAELDFPLVVPPGRRGLAPDLSVSYNSGGGNSWLGVGWDLQISSIEVSTLFGVPRYARNVETETYFLNGEPLAPAADRAKPVARVTDRVFTRRSEGSFQRIVRRGSAPDSYSWEVTDKDGTRWIYGETAQARLRDVREPRNTVRWFLEKVVDLQGNTMEYTYAADGPKAGEAGEPWTQVYPARIDYTGGHGAPYYRVLFVRDDGSRPDKTSSGLPGFKTVLRHRLERVDVQAGAARELVRSYRFEYREGEFRKSLLDAISMIGEDGETELYRHTFEYFGMPRTASGYAGFAAAETWSGIGSGGATTTASLSAGAHAFAGLAPDPTCSGHAGMQAGVGGGATLTSGLFLDVNGDGLPDRFSTGGGVDLNTFDVATGKTGFKAGSLSETGNGPLTETDELNLDVGVGIHAPGEVAGGSVSWVWSHSNERRSVADMNGDGLPDLLATDGVRFNQGGGFGSQAPAWDGGGLDLSAPGEEQELKKALSLADALRALVLPYEGRVLVEGTVQKREAGGADGVVAEIHRNGGRIWRHTFAADELAACLPGPDDSCRGGLALDVEPGDRLYFLARSIDDTEGDALLWAPRVTYEDRDATAREPWGAPLFVFDAADDFRLAGPPGGSWIAPADGEARVAGSVVKQPTSDDVTVVLRKNLDVAHSLSLGAAETGIFDVTVNVPVKAGDVLAFQVLADSQIDPARVDWQPEILDAQGEPQPVQVGYQVHKLTGFEPPVSWEAPEKGTYSFVLTYNGVEGAPVKLFAQSLHRLLGKTEIPAGGPSRPFSVTATLEKGERVTFTAVKKSFGLHRLIVQGGRVEGPMEELPANTRHEEPAAPAHALSGGWHGWFYGEWNGDKVFRESGLRATSTDFAPAVPQWQGSEEIPQPLWRAVGFDLSHTADGFKPSRRGANISAELRRANVSAGTERPNRFGPGFGLGPGVLRKTYGRTEAGDANVSDTNLSVASGYSEVQIDLLDLNGDGAVDHVAQGVAGFSNGSRFASFAPVPGLTGVRHVDDFNASSALGLGLLFSKKDGQGTAMALLSLLPSSGASTAVSRTRDDLVDVNGDGLPDRVFLATGSESLIVQLNLGYRFGAPELWQLPRWGVVSRCKEDVDLAGLTSLDTLDSISLTRSAAYNGGVALGPIGGGAGVTLSRTLVSLVDVNGDGLADHVAKDGDEGFFRVKLNRGDGWDAEQRWDLADAGWSVSPGDGYNPVGIFHCTDGLELTGNIDVSVSGGTSLCIPLIPPVPVAGMQIEISLQSSGGPGGMQLSFQDLDGDALPDHVLKTGGSSNLWVKRNQAGKVNLLSTVHRPLGGTIALDYRRQGNRVDHSDAEHRIDMPQSQWVLASTTTNDGRGNSYPTTFDYFNDAFYDRQSRESCGYARVRATRPDGSTIDQYFHNQDIYRRHLLYKTVIADAGGRLFQVEETTWDPRPVSGRSDSVFPARTKTSTSFYDGTTTVEGAASLSTTETFDYDTAGNLTTAVDKAGASPDDDVTTLIGYRIDPDKHFTRPESVKLQDSKGRLLRERKGSYDERGNLKSLEQTLTGGRDPVSGAPYTGTANPAWAFEYDTAGNLTSSVDPTGFTRTVSYEPQTLTWPEQVIDSFGFTNSFRYDLKHGQVLEEVDENGQSIRRTLDDFGRLVEVFAPGDPAGEPTLAFEYAPAARPASAVVHHKDAARPGDPIDTAVFVDGLGRTLQTQEDAEIDTGTGTSTRTGTRVGGRHKLDALGRVVSQGQPVFVDGPAASFKEKVDLVQETTFEYDVLDRVLAAHFPQKADTSISYGFALLDGETRFLTTRTDPNKRTVRVYQDVQGATLQVEQTQTVSGANRPRITRYGYDVLSQLTSVTDPLGHVTRLEYDSLGRNTVTVDPDAGRTELLWTPGGDLGARITANLAARGQQIRYLRTFHRLDRIDYPEMPDAVFTWGGSGASGNRAGRIATVTDESGVEERFYGPLGDVVRSVKTARALNGSTPRGPYTTTFEHDSLGRLRSVGYPDGEVVTYAFNAGGDLASVSGSLRGSRYDYVAHAGYDELGARVRTVFGNGAETRTTYDPASRELARLETLARGGRQLQNLRYTRDKAGIILAVQNDVPVPQSSLAGGPVTQSFVYDDLYQLVSARGSYSTGPNLRSSYTLSLSYDAAGDITAKKQNHETTRGGKTNVEKKTTYNWTYAYGGAHPHAPTRISERTFTYDPNGNQTGWINDLNRTRRTNVWDEENRLKSVADDGRTTSFLYDAAGVRTNKQGQHGETIYVNSYYSVRNGTIGSKHVFADGARVASQVVLDPPEGPAVYFYHADPQGSASFITGGDGQVYQHLEYFPSGEIWVDERSETQRTPYLFSGKELDEETGLSYFGARYYEARQGQWLSADPILDEMLDTGRLAQPDLSARPFWPAGQMYAYVANSPTNLTDPTGLAKTPRDIKVGGTPSKNKSKAGRALKAEAIAEGRLWKDAHGKWRIRLTVGEGAAEHEEEMEFGPNVHMGHRIDAVRFWNAQGRFFGNRHRIYVRGFMKAKKTYKFQKGSENMSNGAKVGKIYQYLPEHSVLYDYMTGPGDSKWVPFINELKKARQQFLKPEERNDLKEHLPPEIQDLVLMLFRWMEERWERRSGGEVFPPHRLFELEAAVAHLLQPLDCWPGLVDAA